MRCFDTDGKKKMKKKVIVMKMQWKMMRKTRFSTRMMRRGKGESKKVKMK